MLRHSSGAYSAGSIGCASIGSVAKKAISEAAARRTSMRAPFDAHGYGFARFKARAPRHTARQLRRWRPSSRFARSNDWVTHPGFLDGTPKGSFGTRAWP